MQLACPTPAGVLYKIKHCNKEFRNRLQEAGVKKLLFSVISEFKGMEKIRLDMWEGQYGIDSI